MFATRKILCTVCLIFGLLLTSKPSRADFFDWIMGEEPTPWSTTSDNVRGNRLFNWRPVTTTTVQPAVPATPAVPAVVNYAPVRQYRTQWVQVPVTTYRPTFETNPQTGLPALQMRACRRYMWQVRRVPVTVMRPFQNGSTAGNCSIFPWCWNWTPWTNNCCTPVYGTTTSVSPQPYYSGPDSQQPVLAVPPTTGTPASGGNAADQVPTLPNDSQGSSNNEVNGGTASQFEQNGQSILRRPIDNAAPGLEPSIPRIIAPSKTEPIPDLDRQPLLQNQGPQLLNPRDRTTKALPSNWHSEAIQWASLPRKQALSSTSTTISSQVIQQPSEDLPAPLQWKRIRP